MTADVEIISELKEDILVLKTSAIKSQWDKKIVTLNVKGQIKQIEIEAGITGDGKTEILSWLKLGDKIITGEFNINSEEEASTLFGTPGKWRWEWKRPK
jgi:hypothetical protein